MVKKKGVKVRELQQPKGGMLDGLQKGERGLVNSALGLFDGGRKRPRMERLEDQGNTAANILGVE